MMPTMHKIVAFEPIGVRICLSTDIAPLSGWASLGHRPLGSRLFYLGAPVASVLRHQACRGGGSKVRFSRL